MSFTYFHKFRKALAFYTNKGSGKQSLVYAR